jgi:hypothetical protein
VKRIPEGKDKTYTGFGPNSYAANSTITTATINIIIVTLVAILNHHGSRADCGV